MLRQGGAAVGARSSTCSPACARRRRDLDALRCARASVTVDRDHVDGVRRGVRLPGQGHRCRCPTRTCSPSRCTWQLMTEPGVPVPGASARCTSRTPSPRTARSRSARRSTSRVRGREPAPAPQGRGRRLRHARRRGGETSSGSRPRPTCAAARATAAGDPGAASRSPTPPDGGVEWRLPADLGRRYAAVSGDRNPIHLYPLDGEGAGLPAPDRARHVDHGPLPRGAGEPAARRRAGRGRASSKPILLPGTVRFGDRRDRHERTFSLANPKRRLPPPRRAGARALRPPQRVRSRIRPSWATVATSVPSCV